MNSEQINGIFGIAENYLLPDRIKTLIENKEIYSICEQFLELNQDLSYDWFTDYFQDGSADRKKMMQDFTPSALAGILPKLLKPFNSCLDVCSGTGGLTVRAWTYNHDAEFYCEELSGQAFSLLLFNLILRNIKGYAVQKNIITGEILNCFKLSKGDKFSIIERAQYPDNYNVDIVISNPPYSVKWQKTNLNFFGYDLPPSQYADFLFILYAFHKLKEDGEAVFVLPHGVLFRGNKERAIRAQLINNIDAVIGLPEKLFSYTAIPVMLFKLSKKAVENTLFIDASKEFKKGAKLNLLEPEHIKKIVSVYKERKSVDKFATLASLQQIKDNDYNYNIPRYVDNYEAPPEIDVEQLFQDIKAIREEEKATLAELERMTNELFATSPEFASHLDWFKNCIKELSK